MSLATVATPGEATAGETDPVVARAAELVETFAARADGYDRAATFPEEDFEDLFAAGLHAPTVPVEYGGLGLGPCLRRSHPLWMMTAELARADLSLARCWEGHANALTLLDALGDDEQRARWFEGVVERGEKWVGWGGELRAPGPGQARRFATTVTATDDGWVVNGSKAFATGATAADWAILVLNPPSAADRGEGGDDLLLVCDLSHPSVSVDTSWWDPGGMRASASHVVRFDHTPIPSRWRLDEAGEYGRGAWHTAFIPHHAASFLGAAQAAYDYAVDYVTRQGKGGDPYVRQRIGRMAVDIDTARLWLAHAARLWDAGNTATARDGGYRARHLIEHLALEVVDDCVRACGARSLLRPSPVERILRDLTFYVRRDNDDHVLADIGEAVLSPAPDLPADQR